MRGQSGGMVTDNQGPFRAEGTATTRAILKDTLSDHLGSSVKSGRNSDKRRTDPRKNYSRYPLPYLELYAIRWNVSESSILVTALSQQARKIIRKNTQKNVTAYCNTE